MAKTKIRILGNEKGSNKIKSFFWNTSDSEEIELFGQLGSNPKFPITTVPFNIGQVPPTPQPDPFPVVSAGQDQEVIEGALVTLDASVHDNGRIDKAEWIFPDGIDPIPVEGDSTQVQFKAPTNIPFDALGLRFKWEAIDDRGQESFDYVIVTVRKNILVPPVPPTPIPEPETGLIFDSSRDWVGQAGKIISGQFGNIAPNMKGFYTAASGKPKVEFVTPIEYILHGTGGGIHPRLYGAVCNFNARLEWMFKFLDDMVTDNNAKIVNRHQMGGACENRQGGWGGGFKRNTCFLKGEICHNNHEGGHDETLDKQVETGQWYKGALEVRHIDDEIPQKLELDYLDGKGFITVNEDVYKGDYAPYFAKAMFDAHSEFWLRWNNKENADGGAVAYKDVKLFAL